jgi:hypothetical protein
VIAGAAAFRGAPLHPETDSGRLLLKWIEEGGFQWLYTEDILDEYKELLKRFKVRPPRLEAETRLTASVGPRREIPGFHDYRKRSSVLARR